MPSGARSSRNPFADDFKMNDINRDDEDDTGPEDPRIQKALEDNEEALAVMVTAAIREGDDEQDRCEIAAAHGFIMGMQVAMDEPATPNKEDAYINEAGAAALSGILHRIDAMADAHPQAEGMLREIRAPIQALIRDRINTVRKALLALATPAFGSTLATALIDGDDLTDQDYRQCALMDMMKDPVDYVAFATQSRKSLRCHCTYCLRDALNKSELTQAQAIAETAKLWPDQNELMLQYGRSLVKTVRALAHARMHGTQASIHYSDAADPKAAADAASAVLSRFLKGKGS